MKCRGDYLAFAGDYLAVMADSKHSDQTQKEYDGRKDKEEIFRAITVDLAGEIKMHCNGVGIVRQHCRCNEGRKQCNQKNELFHGLDSFRFTNYILFYRMVQEINPYILLRFIILYMYHTGCKMLQENASRMEWNLYLIDKCF